MKRWIARIVTLMLAMTGGIAWAADTTARGPLDLRADRYIDSAVVMQIAEGSRVEMIKSEAGWVQVRADGRVGWVRATGLAGEGATVSTLARLDNGRSASGNLVVAAGIRRIPKASKHALIIAVESITAAGVPARRWSGVIDDLIGARLIASRLGIPAANQVEVSQVGATVGTLNSEIANLNERVQPGDQVLVYFSGPGTHVVEDGACVPAWTMPDGKSMSAATLVRSMRPALLNADKVLFVSDAAYVQVAKDDASRKVVPSACRPGAAAGDMTVVATAVAAGISAQNIVALQSTGNEQGVDIAHGGSVFMQSLTDCFLGDAVDLDQSASISIAEIGACANRRGRNGPLVSITGNAGWSPIVGVASKLSATGPGATTLPRAAIDDVVAQRDGRIDVTLSATPSTLRIGRDWLDLDVTSKHAGFVYLVLLGSDGQSFYLLFPNDLDHDNRIAAGETLRLPRPTWRVQGQGPPGRDTVLAIVAEAERDLAPFAAHKQGPFSTALTDVEGRAQLQWLLGRSGLGATSECVDAGKRRNLAAVQVCSDAFGAAVVEVMEK